MQLFLTHVTARGSENTIGYLLAAKKNSNNLLDFENPIQYIGNN
jgi:hypothetical protein